MWAAASTFAIDGVHVGVRSSDVAADEALRVALAEHLVTGGAAPAHYSLQLAQPARRGALGFHLLHRGAASIVRTTDVRRLFCALLNHLSSHGHESHPGLLRVHAVTLVAGERAVLAPAVLRQWPELIERRLNLRGLRFADTPLALVDPARAEIVVPAPSLDVDWSGLWSALGALAPDGGSRRRPDPPVAPGRYRLVGWAFWVGNDHAGPLSRARAVVHALPLTAGALDTKGGLESRRRALDAVAALMRQLEPAALAADGPVDLVEPLVSLASGVGPEGLPS